MASLSLSLFLFLLFFLALTHTLSSITQRNATNQPANKANVYNKTR